MKKLLAKISIITTVCCVCAFNVKATIHTVQVANFQFTPASINTVSVGDTVRWIWVRG
jgi:plastocyanin